MAEGARLESVFRLTPNEGSNPSLSARLNEKGPRQKLGPFSFIGRERGLGSNPLVRQIRRERIWTHFSAAPKGWRAGSPEQSLGAAVTDSDPGPIGTWRSHAFRASTMNSASKSLSRS